MDEQKLEAAVCNLRALASEMRSAHLDYYAEHAEYIIQLLGGENDLQRKITLRPAPCIADDGNETS